MLCLKRNSENKNKNKKTLSSTQRMYENLDLIYHNNNQRKNVVVQNVNTKVSLGSEAKRHDNAVNGLGDCLLSVCFLPVTTPFAQ